MSDETHIKFYKVTDGPDFDEDGSIFLTVFMSGPDDHEEIRESLIYFEDIETAYEIKNEIMTSFEPLEQPVLDIREEDESKGLN